MMIYEEHGERSPRAQKEIDRLKRGWSYEAEPFIGVFDQLTADEDQIVSLIKDQLGDEFEVIDVDYSTLKESTTDFIFHDFFTKETQKRENTGRKRVYIFRGMNEVFKNEREHYRFRLAVDSLLRKLRPDPLTPNQFYPLILLSSEDYDKYILGPGGNIRTLRGYHLN